MDGVKMKLKSNLLFMILSNPMGDNRYSKSFLNLKNVFELEEKEDGFNFPKEIIVKYNGLKAMFDSFMANIPLIVVERYYSENKQNMNKFCYLEFEENELTDIKISELFYKLENFFNRVFDLACVIANYYNLEVKLNSGNEEDKNYV